MAYHRPCVHMYVLTNDSLFLTRLTQYDFSELVQCASCVFTFKTRAHHRDEKPERDLTYHLTCLLISHGTTTHLYSSLLF